MTGCSSQICAEAPMSSDCAYLDWYICFEYSSCGNYGYQESCGWDITNEFLACLNNFNVDVGCADIDACNYNSDAVVDNGNCEYFNPEIMCDCDALVDINGDCCSVLMIDECGVCEGDGTSCEDCESDEDCENGWCRCIFDEETWSITSFECVPYAESGDYCGGYVMPCNEEICSPELDCIDMHPDIADEPGICGILGCTGESSCNYNPNATIDDGSCIYSEPFYDCYGNCIDLDYDADGICDIEDMDDDNDGIVDSEDCAPNNANASELDCGGVCGGDNSTADNCCGLPFNDDCTSDCYEDPNTGECCPIWDVDECGVCGGVNSCLCENPLINVSGQCLHQDDIAVLQDMIDNSLNSGYNNEDCYDLSCSSPNLYMDQDNWHWVIIDDISYQFSNNNGIVEPLELGLQEWNDGRLTSLMCGAYIYCGLSGDIPGSISNLTEIKVLRLEVNYFSGYVPDSICDLDYVNYEDYLAFDLSYNQLCPPYPNCIPESAVQYMNSSEDCIMGDTNGDGLINVLDVVGVVGAILDGEHLDDGDINGDGLINVLDVVALVGIILNG